jgi:hypothetical protein
MLACFFFLWGLWVLLEGITLIVLRTMGYTGAFTVFKALSEASTIAIPLIQLGVGIFTLVKKREDWRTGFLRMCLAVAFALGPLALAVLLSHLSYYPGTPAATVWRTSIGPLTVAEWLTFFFGGVLTLLGIFLFFQCCGSYSKDRA